MPLWVTVSRIDEALLTLDQSHGELYVAAEPLKVRQTYSRT
jgi:hypothetical protein